MTAAQHFPEALTLCLEGHLIDSLTLAKVIDTIQSLGGDYQLNHLSIGSQKNQLSSVTLTLLAPHPGKLSEIMEALQPYGAKPLSDQDVVLSSTQDDPHQSTLPFPTPNQVRLGGRWIPVQTEGMALVIAVNPQTQTAQLKRIQDLQPEEQWVTGTQGIQWTPPEAQGKASCTI